MKKNDLVDFKMLRQTQRQLELPDGCILPLTWENTNEAILEVDEEGLIVAREKGYATLCVKDAKDRIKHWRVEVTCLEECLEVADSQYLLIYKKWLENLVGNQEESTYKNLIIKNITQQAQVWWESLVIQQETMWDDELTKAYATNPLHLHTHYKRLEDMARGYQLPGSECYQNKALLAVILEGMEWLYQKGYHPREQYGNWWEWEIGIPKTLINLCVLLRSELGERLVRRYTDAIYYHQPDPFHMGSSEGSRYRYMEHQGANRVDTAVVAMGLGMLRRDYEQLILAKEAVESVLKLQHKQEGEYIDGFYPDGSFIQHSHVPYTGTYGGVLLEGAAYMIHMLNGTPWAIRKQKIEQLLQFTEAHFMPVIYKGAALDMVRGRAVARPHQSDRYSGAEIIASIAVLAEALGKEAEGQAIALRKVVKIWLMEEQYRPILEHTSDFTKLACLEKIMKEVVLAEHTLPHLHKNFSLMNRVIHRTDTYLFALSLHSQSISNYEKGGQTENPFGWHTADGMYYLYNTDLSHYSEQYWNTVDPYRLPGITLDTQRLAANQGAAQKMTSDWVGGTVLDEKNGSQGMWYKGNAFEQDLEAKKSWFMLGDTIVCLGAAIQSKQGRVIETIIENRKINQDASNRLVVKNNLKASQDQLTTYSAYELHKEHKGCLRVDTQWIHLEGNVEGADIGYYFPENSNEIYVEQVTRKGKWSSIYFDGDTQLHTREYVEMWVDHGVNPEGATYAYAILPGKSVEQMADYIKQVPFTIIENTSRMQAIKVLGEGIVGMNIWETGGVSLDEIKVDTPSAILLRKQKGILELAIADPTMHATTPIKIEINECVGEILSKDERITIIQKVPTLQLYVDVNQAMGQTIKLKVRLQSIN